MTLADLRSNQCLSVKSVLCSLTWQAGPFTEEDFSSQLIQDLALHLQSQLYFPLQCFSQIAIKKKTAYLQYNLCQKEESSFYLHILAKYLPGNMWKENRISVIPFRGELAAAWWNESF